MKESTLNWVKVGGRLAIDVGAGYLFGRVADVLPVPEGMSQIGKVADVVLKKVGAWGCGIAVGEVAGKYTDDLIDSIFEPVIEDDDEPIYETE